MSISTDERFELRYDFQQGRRRIAGVETVLHCHHYNARIQRIVEAATAIDGRELYVSTAEAVFYRWLTDQFRDTETVDERLQFSADLFARLGYGRLDLSSLGDGEATSSTSHFVEGWTASFPQRKDRVCSFTEGFLQAAYSAVWNRPVWVREVECQVNGAPKCRFEVCRERDVPIATYDKRSVPSVNAPFRHTPLDTNVDEDLIINALAEMPIDGDSDGLIPAFNVYLACTPADFYNLVIIRFIEEMSQKHLGGIARSQLIHAAETCALNTFRGIMMSTEWESLVQPMIRSRDDELCGILAVANALGWGRSEIEKLVPFESLVLRSANGYEALGYRELRGVSSQSECMMLTGVAAGIFALVYGEGSLDERFGLFDACETSCLAAGSEACRVAVGNA